MAQRLADTMLDVPSHLSPGRNLTSVDVYISSQCNRRCTYCFLPADFFASGTRMTIECFSGILGWSQQNKVTEITLLGGEPSLHPSFADMVSLASAQGMSVRVVTNGARRFQRLLAGGKIGPDLARVAVSLDTLDEVIQDELRGRGAWQDAMATIELLRKHEVLFDVNVTAVKPVLDGIDALIDFADEASCRRVNIHWPSAMGMGGELGPDQIPERDEWEKLTIQIGSRVESRSDFFVEIERGFLTENEPLSNCALTDFSNLQIMPDGRAYRCGLLVDQAEMASLSMEADQLQLTRPSHGEELLRTSMSHSCGACPVKHADGRRACIYDKISSALPL